MVLRWCEFAFKCLTARKIDSNVNSEVDVRYIADESRDLRYNQSIPFSQYLVYGLKGDIVRTL